MQVAEKRWLKLLLTKKNQTNIQNSIVGLRRLSNNAEQENFVLREAYYKFFDPYFFHFRRSDREKAEEVLRERRKKGKSTEPFTPPPFIPLKAPFASLESLLHSKTLCQILFYGFLHNFSGFATPATPSTPQRARAPRPWTWRHISSPWLCPTRKLFQEPSL